MNTEIKQIKLESVFEDAYTDRYRRLGYTVANISKVEEEGKDYVVINFERDKDDPAHDRLAELETEIDELCEKARAAAGVPDEQKKKRRTISAAIFIVALAVMVAGVALVVTGLLLPDLPMSLGGWACAVAGAVLVIVWSFLRENWRLRKVDILDDAAHPGFGVDIYSRKVEECLKQADEARAGSLSR